MQLQQCSTLVSPCTGSGAVEAALRSLRVAVVRSDLNNELVNTHRVLRDAARRRAMAVCFKQEHRLLSRTKSIAKRKALFKQRLLVSAPRGKAAADPRAAAKFTLALRSVFNSFLKPTSNYNHEKFTAINAERTGLGVCHKRDAFAAIAGAQKGALFFVDPPYLLDKTDDKQYGAGDFDLNEHQRLAKCLRGNRFVLCHRWCKTIAALYKEQGCHVLPVDAIMQVSKKGASRKEMLIVGRGARRSARPPQKKTKK